jgi:dienelactone hydrolase
MCDLDFTDARELDAPIVELDAVVDAARGEAAVDGNRVVIWAFSGGARLVARFLETPPAWLRGVALTYPVAPAVDQVGVPLVVTRVGVERPEIQETVDRLLAAAPDAEVIDVPKGQHGFDLLDHGDASRDAVRRALDAVAALLTRPA